MSTQLTIPEYAQAVLVQGNKTALTEAASGGVGGKAEFPHISVEGSRWRLIDVEGVENVLKTFAINFAIVGINSFVSKAWYKDKFVPGGERGAPDCYSDNGQVPYPDAGLIQSQQCATCDKNVWGSDVNPQNGNKLKACKDTKHVSLMFLNPENLAAEVPEVYSQRLSAMSMINFSNFAKDVAAQGGALDFIVVQAEFDTDASYPLVKFSVLRNMTKDEWEVVNRVRSSDRTVRSTGMDQKVIPIMAEAVNHVPLKLELQQPAATGELTQAQVEAQRAAEADRMARVQAARIAHDKLAADNAAADKARMEKRAAELAAAAAPATPAETPAQKKLREAREALAALEAEAGITDVPSFPADAQDVNKVTDITPKVRQRSPVNVVQPDKPSDDMEALLAAAMGGNAS